MNEFDMEMTLQTSRRYLDEIEGNIMKIVCKMIVFNKCSMNSLLFNIDSYIPNVNLNVLV